jgi:putative PIN family toxin of toxin-antitoxin system
VCSTNSILAETQRVLLEYSRIRRRYEYKDQKVFDYIQGLHVLARLSTDLPAIRAVRDPEDDVVIATALASQASYVVTRDKDFLSLRTHEGITITTPEDFMALLRQRS